MEELKRKEEPGMAFVGVLLLIVFGIMIFNDRPVQSPRPYDTLYPQPLDRNLADHSYESWPWEDPFDFKPGEILERDLYQIEIDPNLNEKQKLQIRLHKSVDGQDFAEERDSDKDLEKTQDKKLCSTQFQEKLINIRNERNSKNFKILASVVKIHPRTIENKENRTRQRYAINAGLIASDYRAFEPNRLNFCTTDNKHNGKYNVRWEYFRHDSKDDVIVIWIDSNTNIEAVEWPLRVTIYQDASGLFLWPITEPYENKIYLYDLHDPIKNKNFNSDELWLKGQKFRLVKPIYLDKDENQKQLTNDLIAKLGKELKLRGIDKLSEIAIIAEQDSDLATQLTKVFNENLKEDKEISTNLEKCNRENSNNQTKQCEISQFSYFKGLDANQQAVKKRDKPDSRGNDKNWNDYFSLHSHENPSIGHAQFDYLHRLSHQIRDNNKESQRKFHKNRIKAIGIFGSDFYDKLVILEALWRENPNIIYFTTDLDAQMLQPEYWNWTRNLIVASHFDLQLHEDLQKPSPPFRDSLQTEIYYQTLNLLSVPENKFKNYDEFKKVEPLIFEIGRNGPIYLWQEPLSESTSDGNNTLQESTKTSGKKSIHPDYDQQQQLIYYLSFVFLIFVALILTEYQMRPNSGALTFFLSGSAILLFLVIYFFAYKDTNNEPLSFTDGVSILPTILIRLFTICLTLAFIIKLIRKLEVSFDRLDKRGLSIQESNPELKTLFPDKRRKTEEEILKGIAGFFCTTISNILSNKEIKASIVFMLLGTCIYGLTLIIFEKSDLEIPLLIILLTTLIIFYPCFSRRNPDKKSELVSYLWIEEAIVLAIVLISLFTFLLGWHSHIEKLFGEKYILTTLILIALLIITYCVTSGIIEKLKSYCIRFIGFLSIFIIFIPIAQIISEHRELIGLIAIFLLFIFLYNPQIKSIQKWAQNDLKKVMNAIDLWREYREHDLLEQRLLRTTVMWLIFMNINAFLTHLFPESSSLCRGNSCLWDHWISVISFSIVMFLIFLVLDVQRLCIHWIEKLHTKHPLLVNETFFELNIKNLHQELEKSKINKEQKWKFNCFYKPALEIDSKIKQINEEIEFLKQTQEKQKEERRKYRTTLESLEEIVLLVAERTYVVDRLIYFPIIVLMLMFLARILYFDYLDFPLSHGIVSIISISLLLYAGLKLRTEASELKLAVINNTQEKDEMKKRLERINYGAFQPMSEQPVVRSALLLFGSLGLFAAEYLMLFGY